MIPRIDIVGLKLDVGIEKLQQEFIVTKFTRMPIYNNGGEEIIGFVHVKDILPYIGEKKNFDLKCILRKTTYVSRGIKCIDLFEKMRKETSHMAIIVDEYGGVEGLVTIEHLVEDLIGEIQSEHENHTVSEKLIIQVNPFTYRIDGRAQLEDVEEALGIDSSIFTEEEGEFDTIGGFVLSYLDRIPAKDEKFEHPSGIIIEILDATPRKIKLMQFTMKVG